MIDIPNSPTNGSTITLGTTKYTYQDGKLTPFMIKQVGTELSSSKLNVETLTEFRHPVSGKPVYTKTINFGSLPNKTGKQVAHGVVNAEDIWLDDTRSYVYNPNGSTHQTQYVHPASLASSWYSNTNRTNVTIETGKNWTTMTATLTILYTKTTDTANSPVASLYTGSLNELNLNQETHAGYRRNGKDVYQIEVDFGFLPNNSTKSVEVPILELNYTCWIDGSNSYVYVSQEQYEEYYPVNMPATTILANQITCYVSTKTKSVTIMTGINRSMQTAKVVLHYTK